MASLSGHGGRAPSGDEAGKTLQRMIQSIKAGSVGTFIPFDRQGQPILFN